jgi:hypothetical protein
MSAADAPSGKRRAGLVPNFGPAQPNARRRKRLEFLEGRPHRPSMGFDNPFVAAEDSNKRDRFTRMLPAWCINSAYRSLCFPFAFYSSTKCEGLCAWLKPCLRPKCGPAPHAMKRRTRLAAMRVNDATHDITNSDRRCPAVDMEMPRPVASATYAATQAGHFGRSANVAPGTIHPAISPQRRNRDAGRREMSRARIAVWQQ